MKFLILCTFLVCSTAFAGKKPNATIDTEKVKSLVYSFYLSKAAASKNFINSLLLESDNRPGDCDPGHQPPSVSNCINVACNHLGQYGCDDNTEIQNVAAACRGVDGGCLEASCAHLGPFGCDNFTKIQNVTGLCRKVFDSRCMDVVCKHLGQYGCDDFTEISNVSNVCAGRVDSDCIESVCQRLGPYGCDDFTEIQNVAKTCSGQN